MIIIGTAKTRAQNKFITKAYDRINLTVPKGKKELIQAYAKAHGESVNAFLNRVADEAMERDRAAQAGSEGLLEGKEKAGE